MNARDYETLVDDSGNPHWDNACRVFIAHRVRHATPKDMELVREVFLAGYAAGMHGLAKWSTDEDRMAFVNSFRDTVLRELRIPGKTT